MRIPDSVIDEIARRVDIVELIGGYVRLEQKGARFVGLCPFHGEKTPSFSVDREVGAYYCFGCQRGGGVFSFLMEMDGLTFPEAVRQLGERVGVPVEQEASDPAARTRHALVELYNRVARTFAHFLRTDSGARALETLHERAISDETIDRFGLGFAPQDAFWLARFLAHKGYSEDFLKNSGLFTRANRQRALFAGRIMFPIRSARADVLAFGGRIVAGDGPKYINSPETTIYRKREQLFGIDLALPAIRRERAVVIAEGYMDVLALHQAGVSTAVAPLGTAFTSEQSTYLARHVDRVVLLFDADEAGARATQRAAELFAPHELTVSVCVLDPGSDPADLLQSGGSQSVLNAVSSPLTVLEFLVRQRLQEHAALSRGRGASPETKSAVLKGVYPLVSRMGSQVQREESLRLIADLVGADVEAVRRDYAALTRAPRHSSGDAASGTTTRGVAVSPDERRLSHDLFLMLATARNREHFAYVRRYVQPEDLEDDAAREIYLALEEAYRRGEQSLDGLLVRITKPDVAQLVQLRVASAEFIEHGERSVRDAVTAIRTRVLSRQRSAVEAELRRIASGGDTGHDYLELLSEKMHLDRELLKLKGEG